MATKKRQPTDDVPSLPTSFDNHPFYGIELDGEQIKFANAILDPGNDIIFVNAKAGTGKTTVATGVANILYQCGKYDGIVYIMSPYGERKQGWLPGNITEKSSVYFEAFYQALIKCNVNPLSAISDDTLANQKAGVSFITCITDTFLRGSNIDRSVVIIDEAQNYTAEQLKKVLTRIGTDCKVIVIGHDQQCDLEHRETSGFTKYLNHFKGKERAAVCHLLTNHRGWISQWADELSV